VGTITQTDFGYTGQRDLPAMGLMDYKARAYDSLLGRFIQPDTIVPNPADPQSWNSYSYGSNNPVKYSDPTGHRVVCGLMGDSCEAESGALFKESPRARKDDPGSSLADAYMQGWTNFGSAWSIYSNPYAAFSQRTVAGMYMGIWADAHVMLVAGLGGLGCTAAGAACVTVLNGALGIGSALNADGNPTNEVKTIGDFASRLPRLVNSVENWLGDDLEYHRNPAGDFILRNAENTKRFRADFLDPGTHLAPHFHIDWLTETGEWMTQRIFPK
jgi:RHS repeat-associated protein